MLSKIVRIVSIVLMVGKYGQKVVEFLSSIVEAVEEQFGNGRGGAKKEEAIRRAQEGLSMLRLPGWVRRIFSSREVLGWIIDMIVQAYNKVPSSWKK